MNTLEVALHAWKEQKGRYEKLIKIVLAELSKPLHLIRSPEFQAKEDELKQYLKYNYIHDEEEFNEVYVHHIAGKLNLTLMEAALQLTEQLGGKVAFWQTKLNDIGINVSYHPDLTIWEINLAFEVYMGLPADSIVNLRKKRKLAKAYINNLTAICKQIDKSRPTKEDLTKLDDLYKKLTYVQQKYYVFVEQTENTDASKELQSISQRGKNRAKNDLFNFFRKKQEKGNTLTNYNFKVQRAEQPTRRSLLTGNQYQQFDKLFADMTTQRMSQRQSTYSQTSNAKRKSKSKEKKKKEKDTKFPLSQLRTEYNEFMSNKRMELDLTRRKEEHFTFIWNRQYYFSYCGYLVRPIQQMVFTQPFQIYEPIQYDIDSADEFDELNAEDIDCDDDRSSQSSLSINNNSFVVDDDYESQEEKHREKDRILKKQNNIEQDGWSKTGQELLKDYQIICCEPSGPVPLQETADNFDDQLVQKLQGKGRSEIFSIFGSEQPNVSKSRIQNLLKNDFRKIKNRNKQIVYVRNNKSQIPELRSERLQAGSDQQTASQVYQISITRPAALPTVHTQEVEGTKTQQRKSRNQTTIIEEQLTEEKQQV